MAKYAYPAIFTKEENGYSVAFPDIEGCFTSGATLPEAMELAEDALCLMLYDREEDGEPIPPALRPARPSGPHRGAGLPGPLRHPLLSEVLQ